MPVDRDRFAQCHKQISFTILASALGRDQRLLAEVSKPFAEICAG